MKDNLRRSFTDEQDLVEYLPSIWEDEEIKDLVNRVNNRFESLLKNAVTVRDEIRTGVRQSEETISITIYEWISRFMARTHRIERIEGVTVGRVSGNIELHLYEQTAQFVPDSLNE